MGLLVFPTVMCICHALHKQVGWRLVSFFPQVDFGVEFVAVA